MNVNSDRSSSRNDLSVHNMLVHEAFSRPTNDQEVQCIFAFHCRFNSFKGFVRCSWLMES